MKEKQILFSAPMVRALQARTKTQTRRAFNDKAGWHFFDGQGDMSLCPYGQPGDLLWVKETFYAFGRWETRFNAEKARDEWHFVDMTLASGKAYSYAADGGQPLPMAGKRAGGVTPKWWKRPAIFMPRAASRITLEITEVRVERLQDISAADCISEGIGFEVRFSGHCLPDGSHFHTSDPRISYWSLWDSINGAGSVEANPWVWCVAFTRLEGQR